jgi:DNA-binding transcriptional MerR regulator
VTNVPSGSNNRTYLSIGEALDSLKAEFPDVTISKIRFLEGQGLVDPERTPSGYRKFTLVDVERLRWVLRQQQESYIPLKVVRERLAEAEAQGIVPRTLPKLPGAPDRTETHADLPATGPGQSQLAVDGLDDFDDLGEDLNDLDTPDSSSSEDEAAFDPRRRLTGGVPVEEDSPESLGEFRHPASRARSAGLRPDPLRTSISSGATIPAARSEATLPPAPAASPNNQSRDRVTQPVPAPASGLGGPSRSTNPPDSLRLGSANPMLGPSGGAAFTFAELASASGLSLDDLRLIEEFGLVVGRQKFDGKYYDDDALLVAKTVVAFRAFGIEPRHLRMYKSAAEREAAFFAQALSPMLHRRGDDARSKAADTMNELRRLGEQLRDATLRNALRDVLDGR